MDEKPLTFDIFLEDINKTVTISIPKNIADKIANDIKEGVEFIKKHTNVNYLSFRFSDKHLIGFPDLGEDYSDPRLSWSIYTQYKDVYLKSKDIEIKPSISVGWTSEHTVYDCYCDIAEDISDKFFEALNKYVP